MNQVLYCNMIWGLSQIDL